METLPAVRTPEQAMALLSLPEERLFRQAAALREAAFGNSVDICAIINARCGDCPMDCRFCSQSRHNRTPIEKFPFLPDDELRKRILELAALPVCHIGIVASGAALSPRELRRMLSVLASLPADVKPRVCASLGRLTAPQLRELRDAGLAFFHHNLETSEAFYPSVCTTQTWRQRLETVHHAREAGLVNCTGGLFGMGESWEDRVDFAFSLRKLGIRHVPINFLHPHPQTPLAHRPVLPAEEALRIIAVFRHILPGATLRVCGGRPTTLGERQREIFAAGADALMVGDYLTTCGRGIGEDLAMISSQNLSVARHG